MSLNEELELERPLQDIGHETMLNIVRTATALSTRGAGLFRKFGLTEARFNVLFVLKYKLKSWTQSELGKRLVVTRASVTSVLDKLEEKALVIRKAVPGNRRIYHVELTRKGLSLLDRVEPHYRAEVHAVLVDLDDAACTQIIGVMEQVRARAAQGI